MRLSSSGGNGWVNSGHSGGAGGLGLAPGHVRELGQLLVERRRLVVAALLRDDVAERVQQLEARVDEVGGGDDVQRLAEQLRESIRILKPLEDRGTLCESQRGLAQVLVQRGKIDDAESYALEARETVGPHDNVSRSTTRMALGLVRAAQGRDEEAEGLLREAVAVLDGNVLLIRRELLAALSGFLRDRGRIDEADAIDDELTGYAELVAV